MGPSERGRAFAVNRDAQQRCTFLTADLYALESVDAFELRDERCADALPTH